MNLLDKTKKSIVFKNISKVEALIQELKNVHESNSSKDIKSKIELLLASEIFTSLFTEGEISSRRMIKKTFSSSYKLSNTFIHDFVDAYAYALKPKLFSVSNLFTLYSLISRNRLDEDNKLDDGMMYRTEDVYIGRNGLKAEFKGFDAKQIQSALSDLCDFLNDRSIDPYLRSVVGHIYFEIIHPYYDFNGRTGRFIPMWVFANENHLNNEMMYFATAVGNYKDQYISLFNKNIDTRTHKIDLDKMVMGMLDLLILHQKQYLWYKKLENQYTNKSSKSFSNIQKDFIWKLMIKIQVSSDAGGWYKLTKDDRDYIELDMAPTQFSRDIRVLESFNIIEISKDKNRKYKLLGYKVL